MDLARFTERMLGARERLYRSNDRMSDEAKADIYTDNLSRAGVTGKIPQAGARNAPSKAKSGKMSRDRKGHARRLKKRGLISERAASSAGL